MQGKVWKVLVDLELERHNLDGAVEIFGKSLLQCYNVPLWTSYMEFIKKVYISHLIRQNQVCDTLLACSVLQNHSIRCVRLSVHGSTALHSVCHV